MNDVKVNYEINFIISKNINQFEKYISNELTENELSYIKYTINSSNNSYMKVYVENNGINYILKCEDEIFNNIKDIIKHKYIFPKLYKNNLNVDLYKRELAKLEHKKTDSWNLLLKK